MSKEIRCFDYVNHPYERVRDELSKDPLKVFQAATKAAASRAQSVASALRVEAGGIGIEAHIKISVEGMEETAPGPMKTPTTRLHLSWQAERMVHLFPLMDAVLSVYPLTSTETQLDFLGHYEPPLGALGKAVDAVAGHRIADASVHRFVKDVAEHLRKTIT